VSIPLQARGNFLSGLLCPATPKCPWRRCESRKTGLYCDGKRSKIDHNTNLDQKPFKLLMLLAARGRPFGPPVSSGLYSKRSTPKQAPTGRDPSKRACTRSKQAVPPGRRARSKQAVPPGRRARSKQAPVSRVPTGVLYRSFSRIYSEISIGYTQKVDFDFLSAAERRFAPTARKRACLAQIRPMSTNVSAQRRRLYEYDRETLKVSARFCRHLCKNLAPRLTKNTYNARVFGKSNFLSFPDLI